MPSWWVLFVVLRKELSLLLLLQLWRNDTDFLSKIFLISHQHVFFFLTIFISHDRLIIFDREHISSNENWGYSSPDHNRSSFKSVPYKVSIKLNQPTHSREREREIARKEMMFNFFLSPLPDCGGPLCLFSRWFTCTYSNSLFISIEKMIPMPAGFLTIK